MAAVLGASPHALSIRIVAEGGVMHIVPLVDSPEHLQRADVASLRRRMKQVRLDPQNLHERVGIAPRTSGSSHALARPVKNVSPQICRFSRFQMRSVPSCVPALCWPTSRLTLSISK